MSATEYLLGAALLILVCASGAAAAAIVVARRMPGANALPRLLAWGLVTALAVFAAHLMPGLVGLLDRWTAALVAVLIAVGAYLLVRRVPVSEAAGEPARPPASPAVSVWIALAGAVAVAAYLIANSLGHANEVLLQQDVTSFHLPNIARWIESGSLWQVDDFIPDRAPGNYPQTGDLFMLAAILPWSSDFLVRFVALPFLALAALGTYGGARELGVARATATVFAAAIPAMPAVGYLGIQGLADPEMLGLFAAGGYFLLRHARTGGRLDLVLAGIGLGLAFGTRWYAVPAVVAVVVVWLAGAIAAGRPRGALARDTGILVGLVALCGGFWLLRNLVESGNPVFPVRVAPLGVTIFDAPPDLFRELQGFSISDYLTRPGIWREYFWDSFLDFMSFVAVGLWAALAAGLAIGWRRRRSSPEARRVLALVAVAALIGLAYLITPYSATGLADEPTFAWVNGRYVVPALIAGAAVAAWLVAGAGRARPWLEAVALLALLDALRRSADFPGGDVSAAALLAGLVLAAAAAAIVVRRPALPARPSPAIAGAAAAAILIVLLIGGRALESDYASDRYRGLDSVVDLVTDRAPEEQKIGIVGDGFGIYWLFGPELGNEVHYVGHRVEEMLRGYETREEFAAALEDGGYDLVLAQDLGTVDPEQPRIQERWLRELGFTPVAEGTNPGVGAPITLYAPPGSPFTAA